MIGLTPDITAVVVVRHGGLRLTFADGLSGEVAVPDRMRGPFADAPTSHGFAAVRVDTQTGTVVWPGGADLAPETLHRGRDGDGAEALAPLKRSYTSGMKTAVSIPDDLFRRADELASQLGKSRSQLYREALSDYIARRDPLAVTTALNELADELADDHGGFVAEAARRLLAASEW